MTLSPPLQLGFLFMRYGHSCDNERATIAHTEHGDMATDWLPNAAIGRVVMAKNNLVLQPLHVPLPNPRLMTEQPANEAKFCCKGCLDLDIINQIF